REIERQDLPAVGREIREEALRLAANRELVGRVVLQDGEAIVAHRADARAVLVDEILAERLEGVAHGSSAGERLGHAARPPRCASAQDARSGWAHVKSCRSPARRSSMAGMERSRAASVPASMPTERR